MTRYVEVQSQLRNQSRAWLVTGAAGFIGLAKQRPDLAGVEPKYGPFRTGDVRHSQADISKIRQCLGYEPTHLVREGLEETLRWYMRERPAHGSGPSAPRPARIPQWQASPAVAG